MQDSLEDDEEEEEGEGEDEDDYGREGEES